MLVLLPFVAGACISVDSDTLATPAPSPDATAPGADGSLRIVSARTAHDPPGIALWLGPFKYVRHPLLGERRLTRDPEPDAAPDVTATHPVTFDLLDTAREAIVARGRSAAAPRPSLSDETREALRALGYLAE